MQFDMTVGIPTMISIVTLACIGIGAWYTLRGTVTENSKGLEKLEDANKEQLSELAKALALADMKAADALSKTEAVRAQCARELDEYKLVVAKEYATNNAIKGVEERVVSAIERLGDRFDKWVDSPRKG